ncbi:protein YhfH [Bacillus sp. 31A1R]|uniref:Protein YhfH n=1 Tax=Robertmurraya mangrovi TaxID=3098077 RepID=A0ABU5ISU6_9BACI|nr:protein YhfH [Bacillus sp. 31A1R]MDZ5470225.1 protein YhfH [Bacillus sp. 31A1R]
MIQSIVEFFKNLPPKECVKCGNKIEEQHECYGNQCDSCMGVTDI